MMSFDEFFKAVHGEGKRADFGPFPWQSMLARQVAESGVWPAVIDLPTASGKTAILDIAVWHLAQQAELPPERRTAPRRIWFVVDRRIVVDEAYERAKMIASWLQRNPTSDIGGALYRISGFDEINSNNKPGPLSVGRLRGGVWRDDGWASFPSQPAILTSTVDQFGSRLLFRGYGMGSGMWPVHAALAGNDSLLVLDEAHLAEPLIQTLEAFKQYRGPRWCEQPLALPWQMTRMSATPPPPPPDATPDTPPESSAPSRFPRDEAERAEALDHPLLRKRAIAWKGARLCRLDQPKATKKRPPDACAAEAAAEVDGFIKSGRKRIAVMLNRVDAAVTMHASLRSRADEVDLVLLTGRMRPFDRDRVLHQWSPWLKSGSAEEPAKPIVVVTTQCLEVGADFSFDALVTECASLDALRQRFGRLDRLGEVGRTQAAILAWHGDLADDAVDPIYGTALRCTWQWLNEVAVEGVVDFGIAAMHTVMDRLSPQQLAGLLPPVVDAPVLMPAYLDAWCQTGPPPAVEAEPSLFLHGKQSSQADVQVAFRRDLHADATDEQWADTLRLMPPVSGELLTVKLHRLRQWLEDEPVPADSDVEGGALSGDVKSTDTPPPRWVKYRGRAEQTKVLHRAADVNPGDVLAFPAGELSSIPPMLGHGDAGGRVDIYEQALMQTGQAAVLRLDSAMLGSWTTQATAQSAVEQVKQWLKPPDEDGIDLEAWPDIRACLETLLPVELKDVLPRLGVIGRSLRGRPRWPRIIDHPAGPGVVLMGPPASRDRNSEADPFADDDESRSLMGEAVSLANHTRQVMDLARRSAAKCVPALADTLALAARWHDEGKREPRFQALLHNTPWPYHPQQDNDLLAKSARSGSQDDRKLRSLLQLGGFRHEMLSLQLASSQENADDDLLLHLIASHHGHARPFAPVFDDPLWTSPPPHHLGSGVAERFWTLTRWHGWWGLAYLEAVLRLADHHASRFPREVSDVTDTDPATRPEAAAHA